MLPKIDSVGGLSANISMNKLAVRYFSGVVAAIAARLITELTPCGAVQRLAYHGVPVLETV